MGTPKNLRSSVMDPLLNFKFIVSWGDAGSAKYSVVAGVSKIGPLSRNTEVAEYREGADPFVTRKIPGQVKYDDINLERGIILDVAFEQWANKVWYYEQSDKLESNQVSLADFRKDVQIQLCNQAGQIVNQYIVFNCWPTKYQAAPDLDASAGNTVALETLTLANEGWVRDDTYKAVKYPSYALPDSPVGGAPPS